MIDKFEQRIELILRNKAEKKAAADAKSGEDVQRQKRVVAHRVKEETLRLVKRAVADFNEKLSPGNLEIRLTPICDEPANSIGAFRIELFEGGSATGWDMECIFDSSGNLEVEFNLPECSERQVISAYNLIGENIEDLLCLFIECASSTEGASAKVRSARYLERL